MLDTKGTNDRVLIKTAECVALPKSKLCFSRRKILSKTRFFSDTKTKNSMTAKSAM